MNKTYQYQVSVRLMTYNHESFIREAMDGIMSQEVDFKVEVVVGDDFSNDRTLDILKEYEDTEHIHIKILEREKGGKYWETRQQKGRLYNFSNILEHCEGKYIALLDGDDYWEDSEKLQLQVNFMEAHPECSVCFTAARFQYEGNPERRYIHRPKGAGKREVFHLKEAIIKGGEFMITASIFFRQKYVEQIPDWVFNSTVGDMPLSLFLGTKGDFGYINRPTCAYRVNASGGWSQQMNFERRRKQVVGFLKTLDDFNAYTDYKYNRLVKAEKFRVKFNDYKSIVKRKLAKTSLGKYLKEKFNL